MTSGCFLPASAIEAICRDVIADIDRKRQRYVQVDGEVAEQQLHTD